MKTVPYTPGQGFVRRLSFLETVPPAYAVPLVSPDELLRLWLHFAEGFSLPCTGDDCENCHLDRRPYGYMLVCGNPSEVTKGSPIEFKILGVPFTSFDYFSKDRRGRILEIGRKKNHKSGSLVIRDVGSFKLNAVDLPNLEQALQSLWSKRCSQVRPHEEWEHVTTDDVAG